MSNTKFSAVTDILVGAIGMPFMISKLSNAHTIEETMDNNNSTTSHSQKWPFIDWPHNNGTCIIWLFSDMVACTASIWNLVIIAFDRFLVSYKINLLQRYTYNDICNCV